MSGRLKFAYEARNRIALYWTMQSKTKDCITKSSYEICTLLGYYEVYSGYSLLTF